MKIKGIDNLSLNEIRDEVSRGGKFVMFTYCISIIVMTFRRSSDIYFVRAKQSSVKYGWPYMLISFLVGWWGIPWGPVYTIQAIFGAFSGKNLTADVLDSLESQYAEENPIQSWDSFNSPSSN